METIASGNDGRAGAGPWGGVTGAASPGMPDLNRRPSPALPSESRSTSRRRVEEVCQSPADQGLIRAAGLSFRLGLSATNRGSRLGGRLSQETVEWGHFCVNTFVETCGSMCKYCGTMIRLEILLNVKILRLSSHGYYCATH